MSKEERTELPIQYQRIVQSINAEEDDSIDIDDLHKDIKVWYIWGPSGIGKTQKAIQLAKENGYKKVHIIKYENGFYSGVGSGEGCAIYDDFRDSHMRASEFINLIDYNIHTMNIKGSYKQNRFKHIIITSIQSPIHIYPNMDDEPRQQWLRRMELIDMEGLIHSPE